MLRSSFLTPDVVELFENVEFGETMLVVDIAVFSTIKKCYSVWGARRKSDMSILIMIRSNLRIVNYVFIVSILPSFSNTVA